MYRAILFDFDGTIIDTHDLILRGMNHVSLQARGIPVSEHEYQSLLGSPLDMQMEMIAPYAKASFTEIFQRWYAVNHDLYAKPCDEMVHMLRLLKAEGYKMGVVTNNSRSCLEMGLRLLGLEDVFECVVTRDDVLDTKPSPEGIFKALRKLHAAPEEALFVGDSAADMMAAHNAEVLPIMVGWTTMSRTRAEELGPSEIIAHAYELLYLLTLLNTESA